MKVAAVTDLLQDADDDEERAELKRKRKALMRKILDATDDSEYAADAAHSAQDRA